MGYMIFLHISVCQPCQMAIKFKWKKNEILTEMRKSKKKKRHPNAIYQYLTQEPLTTFTEHLSPLVFLKLTVVFFKVINFVPRPSPSIHMGCSIHDITKSCSVHMFLYMHMVSLSHQCNDRNHGLPGRTFSMSTMQIK